MKFIAFDPESKVIGQAFLGINAAVDKRLIGPLLIKHGLLDIQPDRWYPLQKLLDVMNDIDKNPDAISNMLTFVSIGQNVAQNVYVPEEIEAFIKDKGFVEFMSVFGSPTYFRDHQGYVGEHAIEKLSDQHLRIVFNTPYPPDFFYGLFHGSATRYCPAYFVAHYQDLAMRDPKPGESVIIHIVVQP